MTLKTVMRGILALLASVAFLSQGSPIAAAETGAGEAGDDGPRLIGDYQERTLPGPGPRPPVPGLSAQDKADIARIERYLDGIRTLTARFYQVSSTGQVSEGVLYLSRPGKIRVEYEPPTPILIVADGRRLIYYDSELKSANSFAIDDTPAGILLRDKLNLGHDIGLIEFKRGKSVFWLTLIDKNNPDIGNLTLTFTDRPLALKKWSVLDPQGVVTTVTLIDTRIGVELAPRLFVFEDPESLYKPFTY